MKKLVYLHGFLSSPESQKAEETRTFFTHHYPDVELVIPELPNEPYKLRFVLEKLIVEHDLVSGDGVRAIGSSMGGYLATWLVETCGGKAVLINPAVKPYELLNDYLGEHVNPYTNVRFNIDEDALEQIVALDTPELRSSKDYFVLLQTGDETLDYREAQRKYVGSRLVIEEGGDHSFINYESHLADIASFLSV